ncbi:MAG TPA: hypothetical protein DDX19_04680 [Rhodopirellula baltica]|nr:hypothetical protein [Rhodopirellula baltica]
MTFPATRWSLAELLLLTLLSLSSVRAEKSPDGEKSELKTFELRIVDPVRPSRTKILGAPNRSDAYNRCS